MKSAIWWVRRDLRLSDNQALTQALAEAEQVIPVFIWDPALLNMAPPTSKPFTFFQKSLCHLAESLLSRGSRLIVRQGNPQNELAQLLEETGAEAIFAEANYSPYARNRDSEIMQQLPLHMTDGMTIHPPTLVMKKDNTPYTVYTPYCRAWNFHQAPQKEDLLPAPTTIVTPEGIASDPLPSDVELPSNVSFHPGEGAAQQRLAEFCISSLSTYDQTRDYMAIEDGTSTLSPYVRYGMLSARQAFVAATEALWSADSPAAQKSVMTWINELVWREFYIAILYHYPYVRERCFRSEYDAIAWDNNEDMFAAWCAGRTGYPIVDAAMRQLVQIGWMHNRARMIVASFLVKDLLIDWRWGEQFFMLHLLDGDPAANNGGWQWTAGTGTDAAPYFRVFNPVLQSKKFDSDGEYIRRWVPELAQVPKKYIHSPWSMPLSLQQQVGCHIGNDYPAPIVDHAWARERVLAAYGAVKR